MSDLAPIPEENIAWVMMMIFKTQYIHHQGWPITIQQLRIKTLLLTLRLTMTMTMTTQLLQVHQGHQALHQHYIIQVPHIILVKSMKCPLCRKNKVVWFMPQESQPGRHLRIYIQMQVRLIWKLILTRQQKGSRSKWPVLVKLHTIFLQQKRELTYNS